MAIVPSSADKFCKGVWTEDLGILKGAFGIMFRSGDGVVCGLQSDVDKALVMNAER